MFGGKRWVWLKTKFRMWGPAWRKFRCVPEPWIPQQFPAPPHVSLDHHCSTGKVRLLSVKLFVNLFSCMQTCEDNFLGLWPWAAKLWFPEQQDILLVWLHYGKCLFLSIIWYTHVSWDWHYISMEFDLSLSAWHWLEAPVDIDDPSLAPKDKWSAPYALLRICMTSCLVGIFLQLKLARR